MREDIVERLADISARLGEQSRALSDIRGELKELKADALARTVELNANSGEHRALREKVHGLDMRVAGLQNERTWAVRIIVGGMIAALLKLVLRI